MDAMNDQKMPGKLRIVFEKAGHPQKPPQFDQNQYVDAQFNPDKLVFNKTANWEKQDAKQRNVPELQFKNSEPTSLTLDLLFDTYDTPDANKEDVRTKYTDKVRNLVLIDEAKHRPPVCQLLWCGDNALLLQGILKTLAYQFTLFTDRGVPVRARLNCTFQEWAGNVDYVRNPPQQSTDLAKTWTVKRGDSLSRIAGIEYGDPALWRPIADLNGIDDPRSLAPGRILAIPALPYKRA